MEMSTENLITWLEAYSSDPLMLALALALATFATEDGALIAGSLLVGSGLTTPLLAISALAGGILAGDIGLYLVGWSARTNTFIRKQLPVKKSRSLRRWLKGKETPVLFVSRFTPGTRLITYVTFGFLKLSLTRFVAVMTVAALVWVSLMVLFVSEIQKAFSTFGAAAGVIAALLVAVTGIVVLRRTMKKHRYNNQLQSEGLTKHD